MGILYNNNKRVQMFQNSNIIKRDVTAVDTPFANLRYRKKVPLYEGGTYPRNWKNSIPVEVPTVSQDNRTQYEREEAHAYADKVNGPVNAGDLPYLLLEDPGRILYGVSKEDAAEVNMITHNPYITEGERLKRKLKLAAVKAPAVILNTALGVGSVSAASLRAPGLHTIGAIGNGIFNPLAGMGIGKRVLGSRVGKYMQNKVLKNVENRGINFMDPSHTLSYVEKNAAIPELPVTYLNRNDARIMSEKVLKDPEKVGLIRVDKPAGMYAKEGNVYLDRAPYFHPEDDQRISRNTTHFSRIMAKDVFGSGWGDTTVAFIDNLDNLKFNSKGHVLDVDPTDTFIYTPKDFKIGNSTTIITRDSKFYNNAKNRGVNNIHFIGENTTDTQWRTFLDAIMDKNKSSDFQFAKNNKYMTEATLERAKKGEAVFDSSSKSHSNSSLVWGESINREKDIQVAIEELKNNYYDFLPPEVIQNEYRKIISSPIFKNLPVEKQRAYLDRIGI